MQEKFTEIASKITEIKSGLANAITNKGVDTAPDAPFSAMIENIGNIAGGEEDEWVKPHDWIDIEAEPLETGEVRVLMCDLLGADNNTIYFARRSGSTNIKASIDWGDGTQEEVDVASANTTVNHEFVGGGVPCDRGYNQYVVRIKFNEPNSAPNWMYFYRDNATSTNNLFSNLLWIYADMQYFTDLRNLTSRTSNFNSTSALLERANLINTNNVTNMSSIFYGCYSLVSIPQLDTRNVIYMTNMFHSCHSLKQVPQLNTEKVYDMNYLFYGCTSIENIPNLDMSNTTRLANIFNGCRLLKNTPPINTENVSGVAYNQNHFGGCTSLTNVSTVTLSKDIKLVISNNPPIPLVKIDVAYNEVNPPIFTETVPIKINNTQLSAESLNKLMAQLPDGNGKTLDLKYNRGSLDCDPSIATAKNWTVLAE